MPRVNSCNELFFLVPELEVESSFVINEDTLQLECNTRGLPSTATLWNKDGVLLNTSEDEYVAYSSLLLNDQLQARYRNTLTLTDPETYGVMSCNVHSDWVTADKRNSGRKSEAIYYNYSVVSGGTFSLHVDVFYTCWG